MNAARYLRDVVEWMTLGGEPEYPGHQPAPSITHVRARDLGPTIVEIAGDRMHRRVWWVGPRDAVKPGDYLDGHRVTELAGEARDIAGHPMYRVLYGEI